MPSALSPAASSANVETAMNRLRGRHGPQPFRSSREPLLLEKALHVWGNRGPTTPLSNSSSAARRLSQDNSFATLAVLESDSMALVAKKDCSRSKPPESSANNRGDDVDDVPIGEPTECASSLPRVGVVMPCRPPSLLMRNKQEIPVIEGIMSGKVLAIEFRCAQIQQHIEEVRGRRLSILSAQRQRLESLSVRRCERQQKALIYEDYVVRVCAWAVTTRLVQGWEHIMDICKTGVAQAQRNRRNQAALILWRSLPLLFRRWRRRLRIRKFRSIARVAWLVVRQRRLRLQSSIRRIRTFFRALDEDPAMRLRRFLHQVTVATRVSRALFVVRRAQFALLQRQWDAMEAYVLLSCPEVAIRAEDLPNLQCLSKPKNGSYDALPAELRCFKNDDYNVFLCRWRNYLRRHHVNYDLPSELAKYRCDPQQRDDLLRQAFARRNVKKRRLVAQAFHDFLAEQRAAKDMLAATFRLRREIAELEVAAEYPSIRPGTRMFETTLQLEEELATQQPFLQALVTNNRLALNAKMGRVQYLRVLLPAKEIREYVEKVLRQRKLAGLLKITATQSPLLELDEHRIL